MKLDLSKVSACLVTKEENYPQEILDDISQYGFGEIKLLLHSDGLYRQFELFSEAKNNIIYYQDDDAICPIRELSERYKPNTMNIAMTQVHFDEYKNTKMTMGIGWGAFFPKSVMKALDIYLDEYGEDDVFKRNCDQILTYLNYPQNRMVLPIANLPWATAPDRMYRQPHHKEFMKAVEIRCKKLLKRRKK